MCSLTEACYSQLRYLNYLKPLNEGALDHPPKPFNDGPSGP